MKVCVVGGGHIGTTLAVYLKHYNPVNKVSLYTRRPEEFNDIIKCNDWERALSFEERIDCISSNPSVAAKNADIIFIALPHFAVEKAFKDIAEHVSNTAFVGVIPGGGGCEFYFGKYFNESKSLFGFQRVPFTAKLERYGEETNLKSWKPFSVVGTQKSNRVKQVCDIIEDCGLKTKMAENYLSIALTPTNPILHTSRTYEIFSAYNKDHVFKDKCKFYVGWTDEASKTMLAMDQELHSVLERITELDTSAIRPLTEHYEAPTIQKMTEKINSIATFQTVYAPMKRTNGDNGFVADLTSRMFIEDFPWGLAIIRSYAEIIGTKAPVMNKLLRWYADYIGLNWYNNERFSGIDLDKTGIPQNYGIHTRKELMSFYL